MFDSKAAPASRHSILALSLLILAVVSLSGCGLFGTHKKVQVPQLLSPLVEADTPRLLAEVNRLAATRSLHGKVDIEFEDTSFAEAGIAEKYRQADGTVTLQRPGKIYLVISVPFIARDIAQMTSDGDKFRVAVLEGEQKYKRFVKGTNNAKYEQLEPNGNPDLDKDKKRPMTARETVSALSNLRPQHLTEALMLSPIADPATSGLLYVRSEFYQEETDSRPRANKNNRIVRGYYLLEEVSPQTAGQPRLLRRFWFDRVNGIRLARIQTFDDTGLLTTDVSYSGETPFGETGQRRLPGRIQITRPHDHYKLSITYQSPSSVDVDRDYPSEAFVLENRWQLAEVDLDARQKPRATP